MLVKKSNSLLLLMLLSALSINSPVQSSQPTGVYKLFNAFGAIQDLFISQGKLNGANQQIFDEATRSLGIEHRGIQARKSGLLIKLLGGYTKACAYQSTNRIYLNDAFLNELTDEQKKFIITHELIHHSQNHGWKAGAATGAISMGAIILSVILAGEKMVTNNALKQYFIKYFTEGFGNARTVSFSIYSLLLAQLVQHQNREADTLAITTGNIKPSDAIGALEHTYMREQRSNNWPWYAKWQAACAPLLLKILSLPVIKQHIQPAACLDDRVAHLMSLQIQNQQDSEAHGS